MTTIKNDVLNFLGLQVNPFSICSNQHVFFPHPSHKNACNDISDGIRQRIGLILLTGMAGIGKTTVVNHVLERLDANVQSVFLRYGNFRFTELVDYICNELEIDLKPRENKIDALSRFLINQYQNEKNIVLFLDEFNCLDYEVVAKLKAISVIPGTSQHVMQVVLVGLPLVEEILANNSNDTIALNCQLTPLSEHEVGPYLKFHLNAAGFEGKNPFKKEAVEQIGQLSRGIPGKINLLCNTAIVIAKYENRKVISDDVIARAAKQALLSSPFEGERTNFPADKVDEVFNYSTVGSFIRSSSKTVAAEDGAQTMPVDPTRNSSQQDTDVDSAVAWSENRFGFLKNQIGLFDALSFHSLIDKKKALGGVVILGVIVVISGIFLFRDNSVNRQVAWLDARGPTRADSHAVARADEVAIASTATGAVEVGAIAIDDNGNEVNALAVVPKPTEIAAFLASNPSPDDNNENDNTLLMTAAWNGQTALARKILGRAADVNRKNKLGQTALLNAAANGHLEIVKALLAANADANAVDDQGNSGLILSAANGHDRIVVRLKREDIDIDHQNHQGWTALMYAAWGGHRKIVDALLESRANALIENEDFISASRLASMQGHWEIVTLLENAEFTHGLSLKEDVQLGR